MTAEKSYRISGHESFPCRYTWLPKAVQGLSREPKLFSDEEKAMVDLGLGKNMVRSVRFWAQVSGVIKAMAKGIGHTPTDLGRFVLEDGGRDPFLEDIRTLWLVHSTGCAISRLLCSDGGQNPKKLANHLCSSTRNAMDLGLARGTQNHS